MSNECINKLAGKTVVWNGDSICAGSTVYGNWATRVGERNAMTYKSYAVGGGTITENVVPITGSGNCAIRVRARSI